EQVSNGPVESVTLENSPLVWKEGRQLLRQYLEEVGYTDTILDMRSKRVRSLLGRSLELNGAVEPSEGAPRAPPGPAGLSGGESLLVKQIEEQIKRNAAGKDGKERLGGSVLGQIPFLQNCEDEDSDEDDELDSVQHKKQRVKLPSKALVPEMEDEDEEDDSEDAINEFDFLGSGEDGEGAPDPRRCTVDGSPHELESRRVKLQGILADLRDVDGLPPKVTGPPPGTPQPRPHEAVILHLVLSLSLSLALYLFLCLSLSFSLSLALSAPPSPPPTRFLWLLLRRLHHGHYRGRGGEPGGLGRSHRHQ
ncbi:STRN4 isoform 13, partial [Pan troglodytes]